MNAVLTLAPLVEAQCTNRDSRLHGPAHWRAVGWFGLTLASRTSGVDRELIALFALFHDAARESDGHDPHHGERAAALVERWCAATLDPRRLACLMAACASHDAGDTSPDPTIGACWDADRLHLWRLGREPRAALLSTDAGRALIPWAAEHISAPATWEAVVSHA